jgi:hypothetical protein
MTRAVEAATLIPGYRRWLFSRDRVVIAADQSRESFRNTSPEFTSKAPSMSFKRSDFGPEAVVHRDFPCLLVCQKRS